MHRLTILVGPPGSGKSTHSKAMEASGYVRISQDEQGKNHLNVFYDLIKTGQDIVIDRMNFDKAQRDRYSLPAQKLGYTVNFVEFVVPRQICFDRCMERENHPTINGIERTRFIKNVFDEPELLKEEKIKQATHALNLFFTRYEEIKDEEGELLRIHCEPQEKADAIMVDLDGTLCNLNHRLKYVRGEGKKNWVKFFKECIYDEVYEDVRRIVELEFQAGTSVVLCSGRPEEYRKATEYWLQKHNIPYTSLKMRPEKNYKTDDITKAMLYRYEIKPFYNVQYVLDDRNSVVNKWRSMGLNCLQVRPGDF